MLSKGDTFGEFSLLDHEMKLQCISPVDGKRRVIYFYPKDNTRKCREQACSFRDWQNVFLEKGIEVIGISGDSPKSHAKFMAKNNLNFKLLSDTKGTVRKLFGATTFFGLLPSRKTFLINEKGVVTYIYEALFDGEEHVENVLRELKSDGAI